jgi:hypothetical protein
MVLVPAYLNILTINYWNILSLSNALNEVGNAWSFTISEMYFKFNLTNVDILFFHRFNCFLCWQLTTSYFC